MLQKPLSFRAEKAVGEGEGAGLRVPELCKQMARCGRSGVGLPCADTEESSRRPIPSR